MPQEKLAGREYAKRERATRSGGLDAYLEDVLEGGTNATSLDKAWTNTTRARPDTIDRKNRED